MHVFWRNARLVPARHEKAEERADAEGDADGLVGMFMLDLNCFARDPCCLRFVGAGLRALYWAGVSSIICASVVKV